jgi:hypothetical protein
MGRGRWFWNLIKKDSIQMEFKAEFEFQQTKEMH